MGLTKELKDFFNPQDSEEEMSDQKGRFVLTGQQLLGGMMLYTVTDRETGVSYLTKPGSHKAHELLHTSYTKRSLYSD